MTHWTDVLGWTALEPLIRPMIRARAVRRMQEATLMARLSSTLEGLVGRYPELLLGHP